MERRSPNLLDLIPRSGKCTTATMVGFSEGFGEGKERHLELRLGLPEEHEWSPSLEQEGKVESSVEVGFLQLNSACHERSTSDPLEANAAAVSLFNGSLGSKAANVRVVGWPPVRSSRKNLVSATKSSFQVQKMVAGSSQKAKMVKINMQGVPIGRKVDLAAYRSYKELCTAAHHLFRGLLAAQVDPAIAEEQQDAEEAEITLVYEDEDGDRLLVGDVPWNMFIATARRLHVLKSCDLSSASMKAES